MPKIYKKTAKKIGKGVNPTDRMGPLSGPDMDKLFKGIADTPPPLSPIDEAEEAKKKKDKMKKSIFNS